MPNISNGTMLVTLLTSKRVALVCQHQLILLFLKKLVVIEMLAATVTQRTFKNSSSKNLC